MHGRPMMVDGIDRRTTAEDEIEHEASRSGAGR